MRYEVDIDGYGAITVEARKGGTIEMWMNETDLDVSVKFIFTKEEFDIFSRAVTNVKNDLARQ